MLGDDAIGTAWNLIYCQPIIIDLSVPSEAHILDRCTALGALMWLFIGSVAAARLLGNRCSFPMSNILATDWDQMMKNSIW